MAGRSPDLRILVGRIGAAHGVRGEVRLSAFTADPLAIASYGPLATDRPDLNVSIEAARLAGTVVVARLAGVSDRNAAEALNGLSLFVERTQLPEIEDEDDFYHADLLGLEARLENGTLVGVVTAVPNFGAGDLLEVSDRQTGQSFLFPFSKAVVPEIRIKDGYLVVHPPSDADPGEEEPD